MRYPLLSKVINRLTFAFFLLTKSRPRGMVALSAKTANEIYGARPDITIHVYTHDVGLPLAPPKALPGEAGAPSRFLFPKENTIYEATLLDIRNPEFTFQSDHLLDDEKHVIYEPKLKFEYLPIRNKFLKPCTKLSGTVAYLSNTLFCQYGHWLNTQLPLLASYWDTFGKENIDYYYIGDGIVKDFVEESLIYMGIRKEQIVNFPCYADRSLISIKYRDLYTDGVRNGFKMDPYTHKFLKKFLFKPSASDKELRSKRIFVMRGNVKERKELNLSAINAALSPLGFDFLSMDGKSMQEEADIFFNADVIIGVHGSALHNTLFSRAGTTVIEIFGNDYFEASNYVISTLNNCNYYYLIGESIYDAPGIDRRYAHVVVDINKLLAICAVAGITNDNS